MAFTPEQETQLLQVLEAFTNGKRLNELPQIGNTNPFDLIVEVLDTDGESKQSKLAAMLPYIEDQCSYGIEWDTTVSSPLCTRIGNVGLHQSLPVQNGMRGCLLSDAGTVLEYLNPTNWEAHTRDGSNGQVMVEIPAHYRKFETDGTKRRVKVSQYPLPGYHFVKRCYMGAYEASVQRSTLKLCSVVNMAEDFRGGNNNVALDGTYSSLLGKAATAISRTNFRKYARNRNLDTTAWNCNDYNAYKAMFWLYYIEYANFNCQAAFNAQKDVNGFAQGGLGNGVTTLTSAEWSAYNGYYPLIPCGYTDSLGNTSGEVAYAILQEDGSVLKTVYVPRYRGIENPFGHLWKWTDGINVEISSVADGDTSKVYVCDDPAEYNDTNYDGYTLRGLEARAEGYVKSLIFGEQGDIMPAEKGGGSTTYHCDYHYTNIPTSGKVLRGVLFGGYADHGASAGFASATSTNAPSSTPAYVGSRLCFIPVS
jgi:hypothetical protein